MARRRRLVTDFQRVVDASGELASADAQWRAGGYERSSARVWRRRGGTVTARLVWRNRDAAIATVVYTVQSLVLQ